MTRARTDSMAVRATNNVYTVLAGVACIAVLIALVVIYIGFDTLTDGKQTLFFGIF